MPTTAGPAASSALPADSIGAYKLLRVLGEGGLGVVYLAERRNPAQRVALKVIKPGMDSRAVLARFEAERQALALMDHPNIAKVLDAGATPQGYPYFVMEYIQGEPITAYCDRHQLTIPQRLALFIQICSAIQHAHTKGVIHRDIKPSNVLVGVPGGPSADARPHAATHLAAGGLPDVGGAVVKVIDFGVAKATAQPLTERTLVTEMGQLIGTPEYMSPEQAEMSQLDIDTRSDVYSLGVLLYELLTGMLPFESHALRAGSLANIQRTIRELDPPAPSTRVQTLMTLPRTGSDRQSGAAVPSAPHSAVRDITATSIAVISASRRMDPEGLRRVLRNELEWIPLKAMRKARSERYQSPSDLAADVMNYLLGKPLVAAPESRLYRLRKLIARNRAATLVVLLITVILAAAIVAVSLAFLRASRQLDRAMLAEADTLTALAAMTGDPAAIPQLDRSLELRRLVNQPESPEEAYALYLKGDLLMGLYDEGLNTDPPNPASVDRKRERDKQAEALLRKSLDMARRLIATGHTTTALARLSGTKKVKGDVTSVRATAEMACADLVQLLDEQHRYREVIEIHRTRLALLDSGDPEENDAFSRGFTTRALTVALVRDRQFEEAEKLIPAALKASIEPPETTPDPWAVITFYDDLAQAYRDQQRPRDAERLLLLAWDIAKDPAGSAFSRAASIGRTLAEVYTELEKSDKAAEFNRLAEEADVAYNRGSSPAQPSKPNPPVLLVMPRRLISPPFWPVVNCGPFDWFGHEPPG